MPDPLFTSGEACLAPTVLGDGCYPSSATLSEYGQPQMKKTMVKYFASHEL